MRRQKLLPVVRLFLGRLPWRRGKQPKTCFGPGLGTENDFNHLVQFVITAIRTVPFPKGNVAQELLGTVLIMTLPFPVLVLRFLL